MKRQLRGFTLIELMIVIAIIAIIAAIAIPNLIEARKGSNEAAAIGSLRAIATAQAMYRDRDKDGNGINDYAVPDSGIFQTPTQLGAVGLIDQNLASGTKQGYNFYVRAVSDQLPAAWDPRNEFFVIAVPVAFGKSGDRLFYLDQTGVIRFATTNATINYDPATYPGVIGG